MILLLSCVVVWLGLGYVCGGYTYAYFQREFPAIAQERRDTHRRYALVDVFFGPIGLIISLCMKRRGICWNWINKPDLSPKGVGLSAATIRSAWSQLVAANIIPAPPTNNYKRYIDSGNMRDLPTEKSTEPIVGYRVWNLDREKGILKSCVINVEWPKRKAMVRDSLTNDRGIHAVKDKRRMISPDPVPTPWDPVGINPHYGLWNEYRADVAGSVYLWGEVQEHTEGYLAEFAYPKELFMPEDTDPCLVMMLEEHYGVPVTLREEFKKHNSNLDLSTLQQTYNALANSGFPPFTVTTAAALQNWNAINPYHFIQHSQFLLPPSSIGISGVGATPGPATTDTSEPNTSEASE